MSGYSFNRPDFRRMMADIHSIDVIEAKDLFRIGRHNAKVLLFLEEMEEMGYPMHKKKFAPYMERLLELGLVEKTGIYHHPYKIVANQRQLHDAEKRILALGQTRDCPSAMELSGQARISLHPPHS